MSGALFCAFVKFSPGPRGLLHSGVHFQHCLCHPSALQMGIISREAGYAGNGADGMFKHPAATAFRLCHVLGAGLYQIARP
jgi:hypothetical protein